MKSVGLAVIPAAVIGLGLLTSPPAIANPTQTVVQTASGSASWYGAKFQGRRTANGERFDKNKLTAAHRSLPFGTRVRVTNQRNGRKVVVRINDRGPFAGRRIIDLCEDHKALDDTPVHEFVELLRK
jgi:rare lipoprotein A